MINATVPRLCCLAIVLTVQWQSLSAQPKFTVKTTPTETENQIELLANQLEDAQKKSDWKRLDKTLQQLVDLGPEKLPMISERIKDAKTTKARNIYFLQAIYQTDGDQATEVLFDISLTHPDAEVARMAGISINERVLRIPIGEQQMETLISRIESKSDAVAAAHGAYVLARAEHGESQKFARPLIQRFVKEVVDVNKRNFPPVRDAYLSHKAWHLNNFLRVFPYVDSSVSLPLLKEEMGKTQDEQVKTGILIARGMCGDETVAEALRHFVDNKEADASLRRWHFVVMERR